jgi:hypothetical protein
MISNAKLEIAAPVVITFAVFVMHLLLLEEWSTKRLFHHQAMLGDNPMTSGRRVMPPATGDHRNPAGPFGVAQWIDSASPGRGLATILGFSAYRSPRLGCDLECALYRPAAASDNGCGPRDRSLAAVDLNHLRSIGVRVPRHPKIVIPPSDPAAACSCRFLGEAGERPRPGLRTSRRGACRSRAASSGRSRCTATRPQHARPTSPRGRRGRR